MDKYIYCAKQILKTGCSSFIFSCPSNRELSVKNKNMEKLLGVFQTLNFNVNVYNYDQTYEQSKNFNVEDYTNQSDSTSFHFDEKTTNQPNTLQLFNLPPISNCAHLFDPCQVQSSVILNAVYGLTSYSDFEKAFNVLKDNKIKLLGVLSAGKKG